MRKKYKGSAMLWAICSLLIVALLMTGILAISKSYAEEEIENAGKRHSEYMARSGVELTWQLINNGGITGSDDHTVLSSGREIKVDFDFASVTVKKADTRNEYRIISEVPEEKGTPCTVTAVIRYRSGWEMEGYVTG